MSNVADHDRILAGNPFTLKGVDERHLTEIPPPISERECPERPAPGWEKRGVNTAAGWRFFWFDPRYNERARCWQFQVRQDSAVDRYNREVFDDPRLKG
jgi:hypothetical protein